LNYLSVTHRKLRLEVFELIEAGAGCIRSAELDDSAGMAVVVNLHVFDIAVIALDVIVEVKFQHNSVVWCDIPAFDVHEINLYAYNRRNEL
jgi:hypothetical protein